MMMMANVIKKLSCHNNLAVTFNDAAPCCIPVCSESFTVDKKKQMEPVFEPLLQHYELVDMTDVP